MKVTSQIRSLTCRTPKLAGQRLADIDLLIAVAPESSLTVLGFWLGVSLR